MIDSSAVELLARIFFSLVVLVSDAFAADTPAPVIDPAACQALVKHVPDASVAYQPGVDVNGKPVAPADLPGQPQIKLPQRIEFPLTVSLAKLINLDPGTAPGNVLGPGTEAVLGVIAVEGDKVTFNGQPLTSEQQDNLSVLCMKQNQPIISK